MVSSADRPSRKTAARLPAVVLRATRRPLPASRSALTYGRRMAIIHRATLRPSKLELLAGWGPRPPWGGAAAGGPGRGGPRPPPPRAPGGGGPGPGGPRAPPAVTDTADATTVRAG